MAETRNLTEGALYIVASSGTGASWVTASAASGYLMGYVEGVRINSAQDIQTISERGTPKHFKNVGHGPVTFSFDQLWGVTANLLAWENATGDGTTVKLWNVQLKASATEQGTAAAVYQHLFGVAFQSSDFTEQNPADRHTIAALALGKGPVTGSGYF